MLRRFTPVACVALAVAAVALPTGPAMAHEPDPDAPAGASDEWLPNQAWVMERWLPYSETALMSELGVDIEDVRSWLRTDSNLAALARHKRLDPRQIVGRLMAPERSRLSSDDYRELRRRAWKTFTQRHLMQHMLFHPLHTWSFSKAFGSALGTSWPEFHRLQARGLSLVDMGARHGKSKAQVLGTLARALRRGAARGVRRGATSHTQEQAWLRAELETLPQYAAWRPAGARTIRAEARKSASLIRADAASAPVSICILGG